jgi:hypothetical protein
LHVEILTSADQEGTVLRAIVSLVVIACGAFIVSRTSAVLAREGRAAFRRVRGFFLVGVTSVALGMLLPGVFLGRMAPQLGSLVCLLVITGGLLLQIHDMDRG